MKHICTVLYMYEAHLYCTVHVSHRLKTTQVEHVPFFFSFESVSRGSAIGTLHVLFMTKSCSNMNSMYPNIKDRNQKKATNSFPLRNKASKRFRRL